MDAPTSDITSSTASCPGCAQRDRKIAELEAVIKDLKSRMEKLEAGTRAAKRQAAPFSKGPPKVDPKRPGRKSGPEHGIHLHREVPPHIDETYEAPLPGCCSDPNCPGHVHETEVVQQYQTEIPRKPISRQFNIHVGECDVCHRRVQGRHPLQTSDALGAAASQIGPDAQATIVLLNKDAGLSHGKIQRFFQAVYGLELSRAAVCRIMLRAASRCEPTYQAIIQRLRLSAFIVPDETGWRVGGLLAWLHVAVGDIVTAYLIHRKRGYEGAVELIGEDYEGFLIHDGWSAYEGFIYAIHQTCLGHLLRRSKELEESSKGIAARFPHQIKAVLKAALAVRDQRDAGQITSAQAIEQAGVLSRQIIDLVAPPKTNTENERFAKHLWRLQDYLLTFLEFPGVDATNHKAEQAIRPSTANRKVWGGNRTDAGAKAQSILLSVLRTAAQLGVDGLKFIGDTLKARIGQRPQLIPDTG